MIHITKKNEAFLRVECDDIIAMDISEHFSVTIPNYQHTPAFKKSKGGWDGSIRLFSPHKKELLYGHLGELAKFAKRKGVPITLGKGVIDFDNLQTTDIDDFLDAALLPPRFERRPYQYSAAVEALNTKRLIVESPTASGKSFLAYIVLLKLLDAVEGKIAIIVPRTSLVEQLYSDFAEYGLDVDRYCGRIYARYKDNYPKQRVYITTWQSIAKMEASYFHQFDAVIGDEAHGFKAKSLKHIMENCINAGYRIGMTGTVPTKRNDKLVVEGLFGPKFQGESTNALIDKGYLNKMLPIKIDVLKHNDVNKKLISKSTYQEEIEFITDNKDRNAYLLKLAESLDGNTLVLFSRVESHGKLLYNSMNEITKKRTFFVSGEVEAIERERIRKLVLDESNSIVFASMGTFSTGVNIPNLDNLILAAPTKSDISLTQMIGRVLRKSTRPTRIFDIVDDLSYEDKKNYVMHHALERIKLYAKKDFKYEITITNL